MKIPLSKKQKAYYDFIIAFHGSQGIFPSLAEIAKFFNRGKTTVWVAINRLVEKGYLDKYGANKKRMYKIL